ncbi:unnamed protein product [Porites evermanni]|uniref:EF-hand domain-containing protein n=1 Tax=Porites evermanni TaxID=104178 RepID=A0ABN8STS8_9CNID|nr:unnamed protein product [Porites evermanni]
MEIPEVGRLFPSKVPMQSYMHQLSYSNSSWQITEEKLCQIAETFHNADEEKKGFLTSEDLKVAFVSLFGYKPSKSEVQQLMAKFQKPGSSINDQLPGSSKTFVNTQTGMTLENFTEIAKIKILAEDTDDEIRQMFIAFDTKCQGFITLDIAKKIFLQVAPFLDSVTVEKLFREADTDRDGRVSYRDFEFIMKYSMDDET